MQALRPKGIRDFVSNAPLTGQWNVQNLGSTVAQKQMPLPADELAAYAKALEDHYQSKLAKIKALPPADGSSVDGFEQVTSSSGANGKEKVNKPNPCVQYAPDLLGLDKARQDCRFEMIKIVQEVSENQCRSQMVLKGLMTDDGFALCRSTL